MKCPKLFSHGLVTLENIDDKTKSLWENRVPSLLPSPLDSDTDLWVAAFTSIVDSPTYDVYQDGVALSVELSDLPPIFGKETNRQKFLKRRKIEIAAAAMSQVKAATVKAPISSILNIWLDPLSGISMKPPEHIERSHHICEEVFPTSINATPQGCFVDLHYGKPPH